MTGSVERKPIPPFRTGVGALLIGALLSGASEIHAQARFDVMNTTGMSWYRGNTHSHTSESDGDSPPEQVTRWYRDHDYNFLVLSDHNVFTDPDHLSHLTDSGFILILR